jgi:outer membrane lipoprotein SlyB
MKIRYRTIGVAAVSLGLVLATGCVNPDGTQNNTGTGALAGGAFGAFAGAVAGGRHHALEGALIGAAAGAITGGLIGHMIDRDQQQRLQQQSPQTLQTIQHNDAVYQQQQQAAQAQPQPSPAQPSAAPAQTPSAQTPPPATGTIPLTVDDIKAMTAAGIKKEAITQELKISQSRFSAQDIAAVQQANPPVDPDVIAYMKNNPS